MDPFPLYLDLGRAWAKVTGYEDSVLPRFASNALTALGVIPLQKGSSNVHRATDARLKRLHPLCPHGEVRSKQ
jgi:hypothetical protein